MRRPDVKTVVLILAAGEGRRYGSPKQLALLEGEPMIRHVITQLVSPDDYRIVVVLGAWTELIQPEIADLEVDVVLNKEWRTGMASSVRSGVVYAEEHFPNLEGLVIVLGDQWKLDKKNILRLLQHSSQHAQNIIAASYHGSPGVPVYFPREHWSLLMSLQGDEGARKALEKRTDLMLLDIPEASIDLDYPG
jgi:molybdenum cofactor cytidylyltransferase